MKQRVVLGRLSVVLTLVTIAIFVAIMFVGNPPLVVQLPVAGILALISLVGLFYMPLSISVDKYSIYINRSLRIKDIPLAKVKSVKLHTPSSGTIRVSGSGGFMGYWGWFREKGTGIYFAYYGSQDNCFLLELTDGRKYLLGCENHKQMVEAIEGYIK